MNKVLLKDWKLLYENEELPVTVPGDISIDLFNNKKIEDPLFGDNFKRLSWIHERDFIYYTSILISKEMLESEHLSIHLLGVDTYSSVYLNDIEIGSTDSMFIPYNFDIKKCARLGENTLKVIIHPIKKEYDKHTGDFHYGTFNNERIFLRKVQCHFGWDWAVNFPGTGIYKPVEVEYGKKYRIDNVQVRTSNDGLIGFFVNLNFSNRKSPDWNDEFKGFINVLVYDEFDNLVSKKKKEVFGAINQMTLKIDDPKLWYPNGYGDQPIYKYKASLFNDENEEFDSISGTFAIREIVIEEPIKEDDSYGFNIYCNNTRIRVVGGNWVPCSPFTGAIKNSKYERLLKLAKTSNINLLRVWGGGLYENDYFYDLCDKFGILIFQDFMLSCEIVPDDILEFRDVMIKEATYQVKRLRNHPCILLWCGGNELTDSFKINKETYGTYLIKMAFPGIISMLDDKRRYLWNSPYSRTDICNDPTSGDCHKNVHAISLHKGEALNFRDYEPLMLNNFDSECAILGMCRLRNFKKFMPLDKLWPQNDLWKERILSNPFDYCYPDFTTRINELVKVFFGEADSIEDFIKKSMLVHSGILESEIDYYRAHELNTGILSWMYNDYHGNGTWSIVDDSLEPKAALYAMKRAGKRLRTSIIKEKDGYYANIINDTKNIYDGKFIISHESIDGNKYFVKTLEVKVEPFSQIREKIDFDENIKNAFLYSEIDNDCTIFFYDLWKDKKFVKDISFEVLENEENLTRLKIQANEFARSVFINIKEGYDLYISDNYFDLKKGQSTIIEINSDKLIDLDDIEVLTYNDIWKE